MGLSHPRRLASFTAAERVILPPATAPRTNPSVPLSKPSTYKPAPFKTYRGVGDINVGIDEEGSEDEDEDEEDENEEMKLLTPCDCISSTDLTAITPSLRTVLISCEEALRSTSVLITGRPAPTVVS